MLDNSKSPKSEQQQQRTSVYEKLQHNLQNDEKWKQEISLGKRITLYKLQGEIGRGNFSQVKMAVHELTKERVAIKILDKAKLTVKARRMLDREISNMTSIHHPNIIRLFEVIESFSKLFLVMEYASGGELYQKLTAVGKLPEIDAKTIFAQILSAVKYLHQNLIIHRDLKAENVFCSSRGLVKVGDFGFSTRLANGFEEQLKTFCGSPPYAAPELFRDESYVGGPVDVWAMGVLLYFMTTGYMPFPADSIAALKRNILAGVFTVPSHLSSSCRFLIVGILKQTPSERLTLQQIEESDWLEGISVLDHKNEAWSILPTVSSQPGRDNLSSTERLAREKLAALGIAGPTLEAETMHKTRSPVIGTYRIIVHRIQTSAINAHLAPQPPNPQPAKPRQNGIKPNKLGNIFNKPVKSRFCCIL